MFQSACAVLVDKAETIWVQLTRFGWLNWATLWIRCLV